LISFKFNRFNTFTFTFTFIKFFIFWGDNWNGSRTSKAIQDAPIEYGSASSALHAKHSFAMEADCDLSHILKMLPKKVTNKTLQAKTGLFGSEMVSLLAALS